MLLWNFQEAGRADGKEIPSTTLERMISRNSDAARKTCLVFPGCSCLCKVLRWGYEPLPEEVKGWAQPTRRIRFMKFNQIPCPKDVAQSFSNDFLQRVPQHPNNHQQPSTNATKSKTSTWRIWSKLGQNLVASDSLWGVRFWNAAELDLLKSAKPKPRRKQFSRDPMVYVLKPVLRISTYSLLILLPNLTDYALEVEQVCAAQLPLLNRLQVSLCRAWCPDVCPGGSQA